MLVTYIIIGATALFSYLGFENRELFHRYKHWPYAEERRGEYLRWLTGGFLHADWMHLIFNMLTLFFFGRIVEDWFVDTFPGLVGPLFYLAFYLLAIMAASSATYYRHRHNPSFASIGASGAVAAILFAAILLEPTANLYLYFALPIPGFIFGIIYLWYSSYAANNLNDNIDHLAHFYGAVFGFIFPLVFHWELMGDFIEDLRLWFANVLS